MPLITVGIVKEVLLSLNHLYVFWNLFYFFIDTHFNNFIENKWASIESLCNFTAVKNKLSPPLFRQGFWVVFCNVPVGWNERKERPQARGTSAKRSASTAWLSSQFGTDEPPAIFTVVLYTSWICLNERKGPCKIKNSIILVQLNCQIDKMTACYLTFWKINKQFLFQIRQGCFLIQPKYLKPA